MINLNLGNGALQQAQHAQSANAFNDQLGGQTQGGGMMQMLMMLMMMMMQMAGAGGGQQGACQGCAGQQGCQGCCGACASRSQGLGF